MNPVFDEALPFVNASFTMPTFTTNREQRYEFKNEEFYLPFPCILIREPFVLEEDEEFARDVGVEETLYFERDNEHIGCCSRITYTEPFGRAVYYLPEALEDRKDLEHKSLQVNWYSMLDRFICALERPATRYVEQSVSRQVRRREGFSKTYRDYILIPSKRYEGYERGVSRSGLGVALHLVRKHKMTFKADRYVNVKGQTRIIQPHLRGSIGTGFQIKDYRIQEESK